MILFLFEIILEFPYFKVLHLRMEKIGVVDFQKPSLKKDLLFQDT